jgi:glycine dehydrogenase subunit 1
LRKLRQEKILGGFSLNREFPELGQSALVCVTELHTKEDIDKLSAALEQALEMK